MLFTVSNIVLGGGGRGRRGNYSKSVRKTTDCNFQTSTLHEEDIRQRKATYRSEMDTFHANYVRKTLSRVFKSLSSLDFFRLPLIRRQKCLLFHSHSKDILL